MEGVSEKKPTGGPGVRAQGADAGRASPHSGQPREVRSAPRRARGAGAAGGDHRELRLTANRVERGPRPLLEALSQPQAVFLAV